MTSTKVHDETLKINKQGDISMTSTKVHDETLKINYGDA